jgi:hypothetical protein
MLEYTMSAQNELGESGLNKSQTNSRDIGSGISIILAFNNSDCRVRSMRCTERPQDEIINPIPYLV